MIAIFFRTMVDMLSAALACAARKWPVLPCRGKVPAIPKADGGRGVYDATAVPDAVRALWARFPDANVGVATGAPSGIWALDVDGEDGERSLAEYERRHGPLPVTPQQFTGRGRHIFFSYRGELIKNRAGTPAPGLDVRATGGYVIVSPSVHRATGKRYRWDPARHPDQIPFAPAPDWLLKHVRAEPADQAYAGTHPNTDRVAGNGHVRYGEAALRRECDALRTAPWGQQEITLNCAALKIGSIVAAGALHVADARAALVKAGMSMRSQPGREPWTRAAIETKVDHGLRDGMVQPRAIPEHEQARSTTPPWSVRPKNGGATTSAPVGAKPPTTIRADDGDLARMTGRAWEAMIARNQPPRFYRFGTRLHRIEQNDDDASTPVLLTQDRLRHHLAREIKWTRMDADSKHSPAYPPMAVVKDMLATPNVDLPVLHGIVRAPVFAASGTLQTEPGYHPENRLLYVPPDGFDLRPVPERPNEQEIGRARALILEELLGDFPFTGAAERAHVVALLLLPFMRPMIPGPTPLHLIEKPTPGTGATLLIDTIAIVTTGASAGVMTEGRNEDEWRKRITAKLLKTPAMIVLDNLSRPLDSPALSAAITAPAWEDRILGGSITVTLSVRCAWVATGNNPSVSDEIARRTIRSRLDPKRDQPWLRKPAEFRHPDLTKWAHENRSELVWALLTLARAWIAADRPRPAHGRTLGLFEGWADVIGGILEYAGISGFLENLDEFYETSDEEGRVLRALVGAWFGRFASEPVGVKQLYPIAQSLDPSFLGQGSERSQQTRLGKRLAVLRDRRFEISSEHFGALELRLVHAGEATEAQKGAQLWRLERISNGRT